MRRRRRRGVRGSRPPAVDPGENRRAAPDLFADELEQALLMLEQKPMLDAEIVARRELGLVAKPISMSIS